MFHIPSLKAGMKEAGFVVTDGPSMNAKDMSEFYDYAYRVFGLNKAQAGNGLAYPSTVTSAIPGHPANPATPAVEEPVEALIPPVIFPAPVVPSTPDDSEDDELSHTSGEVIETPEAE